MVIWESPHFFWKLALMFALMHKNRNVWDCHMLACFLEGSLCRGCRIGHPGTDGLQPGYYQAHLVVQMCPLPVSIRTTGDQLHVKTVLRNTLWWTSDWTGDQGPCHIDRHAGHSPGKFGQKGVRAYWCHGLFPLATRVENTVLTDDHMLNKQGLEHKEMNTPWKLLFEVNNGFLEMR